MAKDLAPALTHGIQCFAAGKLLHLCVQRSLTAVQIAPQGFVLGKGLGISLLGPLIFFRLRDPAEGRFPPTGPERIHLAA